MIGPFEWEVLEFPHLHTWLTRTPVKKKSSIFKGKPNLSRTLVIVNT